MQQLLQEGKLSRSTELLTDVFYGPVAGRHAPYHYQQETLFVSGEAAKHSRLVGARRLERLPAGAAEMSAFIRARSFLRTLLSNSTEYSADRCACWSTPQTNCCNTDKY